MNMNIVTIFHATANALATYKGWGFDESINALKSEVRTKDLAMHRKAFCAIAKEHSLVSLGTIGEYIGRDHGTVSYHANDSKWARRSSSEYNGIVNNVMKHLEHEINASNKNFASRAGLVEYFNSRLLTYQRKRNETFRKYTLRFLSDHVDDVIRISNQIKN